MQSLKIIFAGTPQFAVPSLRCLIKENYEIIGVYTKPDRPAGRGQRLVASPVKQLAQQYAIPVYQPESLKHVAAQNQLAQLNPDLMIVAAYGLMLPNYVLSLPRYGCINVHASLLPRWRGAAPIQRAILSGDSETGITIMQMDSGLDTGAMLDKISCPILEHDTAQSLHDRLADMGAQALAAVLPALMQQQLQPVQQDLTQACYAEKIVKSEAHLVWQQSATRLARAIRAYNPWPGAYARHLDKTVKIWRASVITAASQAAPGTIISVHKPGIDVATGEGVLRLQELQMPGGKVLTAEQLLNAPHSRWQVGTKFV